MPDRGLVRFFCHNYPRSKILGIDAGADGCISTLGRLRRDAEASIVLEL